jgi:SAM-dependent methyltransferase
MNLRCEERTIGGLHDFLITSVIPPHARSGSRAVDLGAGTGALATRLKDLGLDVLAVDRSSDDFHAELPFVRLDLDDADFDGILGEGEFSLVTAVEVIEHLERPIGLLRRVARLLSPEGVAIMTTPNVDNLPARLKFLLTSRIRMMDHLGDETHISPIFWDLLTRRYLPLAGLTLRAHAVYPPDGYKATRPIYASVFRLLARVAPGPTNVGDNHVLVLMRG